jgi:hypothetical protein
LADALQIRPLSLDFGHQPVLIVEGIVDYYLLELFRSERAITVVPSVGADSMKFYISLMIAWRFRYCALWDNDDAGRRAAEAATSHFGEREAASHFVLLPKASPRAKNRLMQDLVEGAELKTIRQDLGLPPATSFDKTIVAWYYCNRNADIVRKHAPVTKRAFDELYESLPITRITAS